MSSAPVQLDFSKAQKLDSNQLDFSKAQPIQQDGSFLGDTAEGFKTALNQTGETAMRAVHAIPGVGTLLDKTPGWQRSMQQTQNIANAPIDTGGKVLGASAENILEFVAGDEALKGLSTAAKISELSKVEQALTKSPRLTRMLGRAISAQAVGTTQAAVHGAGGTEAVLSGAGAAAGGAAFEGLQAGAGKLLKLIRPTTEEVLGESVPVLASQRPGASPLSESIADIRSEPKIATAQQQGAAQGITNRAQSVAASELDKLNAARRIRWHESEGMMNLAPDAEPLPSNRQLGTGQPQLPASTGGGAPQLEAGEQPSSIARTNEVGPHEGDFAPPDQGAQPTQGAPSTAPQRPGQRVRYVEERSPNFEPIDVANETGDIRNFGDAANKIREHSGPVFDTFNKATNGKYVELRNLRDEAYANDDYKGVAQAENAIDQLFNDTRGKIDRLDYRTAKSAWKTSKTLDAVHEAVSKAFNIPDETIAQDAGVWRGINGGSLMRGMNRLTNTYGRTQLEDVLGKDGVTSLYKIASLTQTPQRAALYGQKIGEVANALAPAQRAGLIPSTVDFTRRMLLHGMAVNPKVARAVEFATDNKVSPKVYAPIIAGMLGGMRSQEDQQGEQQHLSESNDELGTRLTKQALRESPASAVQLQGSENAPLSPDLEDRMKNPKRTQAPFTDRVKQILGQYELKRPADRSFYNPERDASRQ